jgi:hypothetical protein
MPDLLQVTAIAIHPLRRETLQELNAVGKLDVVGKLMEQGFRQSLGVEDWSKMKILSRTGTHFAIK